MIILSKLEHPKKHPPANNVTEEGISIFFKPEQPQKQLVLNDVIEEIQTTMTFEDYVKTHKVKFK